MTNERIEAEGKIDVFVAFGALESVLAGVIDESRSQNMRKVSKETARELLGIIRQRGVTAGGSTRIWPQNKRA